ncbi:hypothetical protein PROFUN_08220 [Planoprotostelium fungivorum]|uniref:Uncharacterized protein n=1 Tax=Planoprotostelium fungivorum TaxID=1890364 RepID=A0A2P6N682_9EUKA|nr:hypothetical protein PROFUN_08220 [Planoprotostelium fungivorum]
MNFNFQGKQLSSTCYQVYFSFCKLKQSTYIEDLHLTVIGAIILPFQHKDSPLWALLTAEPSWLASSFESVKSYRTALSHLRVLIAIISQPKAFLIFAAREVPFSRATFSPILDRPSLDHKKQPKHKDSQDLGSLQEVSVRVLSEMLNKKEQTSSWGPTGENRERIDRGRSAFLHNSFPSRARQPIKLQMSQCPSLSYSCIPAPGSSDSIQELYLLPNCGTSSYQGAVIQYAVACTSQTSIVHDQCQIYIKSPFQQYYEFTCGGGSASYRAPNEAPSTVLVYYSFAQLHYTLYKLHTEACISRKATSSVLQTQHFASYSLQRLQEDVSHCTSEASCRLSTSQDTLPVVRKATSSVLQTQHFASYSLQRLQEDVSHCTSEASCRLSTSQDTLPVESSSSTSYTDTPRAPEAFPPSKSFVSTNYVVLTRNSRHSTTQPSSRLIQLHDLVSKKVRFVLLDTSQDDPTASSDKKDPLHRVNDGSTRRLQHHVERRLHRETSASCKTTAPPGDFSISYHRRLQFQLTQPEKEERPPLRNVFHSTILQQTFQLEYVVAAQQCEACQRKDAKDTCALVPQLELKKQRLDFPVRVLSEMLNKKERTLSWGPTVIFQYSSEDLTVRCKKVRDLVVRVTGRAKLDTTIGQWSRRYCLLVASQSVAGHSIALIHIKVSLAPATDRRLETKITNKQLLRAVNLSTSLATFIATLTAASFFAYKRSRSHRPTEAILKRGYDLQPGSLVLLDCTCSASRTDTSTITCDQEKAIDILNQSPHLALQPLTSKSPSWMPATLPPDLPLQQVTSDIHFRDASFYHSLQHLRRGIIQGSHTGF